MIIYENYATGKIFNKYKFESKLYLHIKKIKNTIKKSLC